MSRPAAASLSVPRSSGRDKWLAEGRAIADLQSHAHWDLGDWALRIPDDVVDDVAAEQVGVAQGLLRTCRWLARRFAKDRRRHELGYSHHLETAALPPEAADKLLDQAVAERWTVARIRTEARFEAARTEAELAAARKRVATERRAGSFAIDARRTERECRQRLIEAATALQLAEDAVAALGEHPERARVHGNRINGIVARLEDVFTPILGLFTAFTRRGDARFKRLLRKPQSAQVLPR